MNIFKRLFRLFEAKTNSLAVGSIKAVDNYNLAATKLMDDIDKLGRQKNANSQAIEQYQAQAKTLNSEANEKELQVKALLGKGNTVDKTVLAIILRKRQLAKGFSNEVEKLQTANTKINTGIVKHSDALENLQAQLELAKIEEQFKSSGIALPGQIDFSIEDTSIEVDRLLKEVEVFTESATQTPVTSLDVDSYMDELLASAKPTAEFRQG
ncbi:hypothetical protein HWB57_gp038 [Erwinia phage vB_EamM-Bue1]|uniref:PspA/IM30 family protein n=1 Tax=Erwinia phage vB_EamM-Bue1 TaxID=2099338 RepID=A0A2P1JU45_9CAUD|nr:hypothetical protein HWB57_gp038 [Erwinia phage vB_EamM-Bue1]AVO22878.1 hypothetical protein [Erwinia phage vB_EamM-Bue1]